ncbi:MAG: cadherin-like domain-containing protein, partial [Pseudomonas sp.]
MAVTLSKINAFTGATENQHYAISYSLLKIRANESSNTDGFLLSDGVDGSLWYKNAAGELTAVNFIAGDVVLRSAGLYINNVLVTGSDARLYWLTDEAVQGGNVADAFGVQAVATDSGTWGGTTAPTYEVSTTTVSVPFSNITPTNDAPVTAPVTLAAFAEDSGARLITSPELLAAAEDVDGNTLTVSNLQISAGRGQLVDNLNGTWSYTPAADDDTGVSFTYTISDGTVTIQGSATLDITPVDETVTNQSPVVATSLVVGANEGNAPFFLNLLDGASDADDDFLFVTNPSFTINGQPSIDLPPGFSLEGNTLSADPASEVFDYLTADEILTVVVSYTIDDANGGTVAQTATVTITGTNDAAILSSALVELVETDAILSTGGTLAISDVDNAETFVAQADVAGTNGVFNIDTAGVWTYVANDAFDGLNVEDTLTDTFTVAAADGTTTTVEVTITGTNDAATLSSALVELVEIDAILSTGGTLTISDVDSEETFVAQADVAGTNGVFNI